MRGNRCSKRSAGIGIGSEACGSLGPKGTALSRKSFRMPGRQRPETAIARNGHRQRLRFLVGLGLMQFEAIELFPLANIPDSKGAITATGHEFSVRRELHRARVAARGRPQAAGRPARYAATQRPRHHPRAHRHLPRPAFWPCPASPIPAGCVPARRDHAPVRGAFMACSFQCPILRAHGVLVPYFGSPDFRGTHQFPASRARGRGYVRARR